MSEEKKKPKGMLLLLRWQKNFNALSDESAGRMVKAMFEYETNNSNIVFNDAVLDFFWNEVRDWLDASRQHWKDVVEKRSEAGRISAAVKKSNKRQHMLASVGKGKGKGKGNGNGKGKGIKEEKEIRSYTSITSSSVSEPDFADDILSGSE